MNCELLPLWKKGELLTVYRLNQQVRAINFLIQTLGGVLPRVSLANYNPNTQASFPGLVNGIYICASIPRPCIENGAIFIPETTGDFSKCLTSAVWDNSIAVPQVVDSVLHLNPAADLQPGYVSSVCFDSIEGSPSLQSGGIHLPAAGDNSPGFLSAIEYIEFATTPSIICGKILLNPADSTSEARPGYIKSVRYNSSLTAPVIENGDIQLNPADANVPGYVHDIVYNPDSTIPDIYQGKIRLNPAHYDPSDVISAPSSGYVSAVEYSETATAPAISRGRIQLNPAHHDPTDTSAYPRPGYITSVESFAYDPSDASVSSAEKKPRITNGKIIIPTPIHGIEDKSCTGLSASPGVDGWVQTFFIRGVYQNGSVQFEKWDRQLMRFSDTTLQVVRQTSYDSGATWSDASI